MQTAEGTFHLEIVTPWGERLMIQIVPPKPYLPVHPGPYRLLIQRCSYYDCNRLYTIAALLHYTSLFRSNTKKRTGRLSATFHEPLFPELFNLSHKTSTLRRVLLRRAGALFGTLERAAYANCRRDLPSRDRHALGRASDDSNRASETVLARPSRTISPADPTLQLLRLQPAVYDRCALTLHVALPI